jgi:hypothetical protein
MVCWTNNEGVKECGDRLPPEYAQQEHKELNERGMVVEEVKRAKTEEELEEEKKLAKAQAEQERITKEQSNKDKILLDTFATVEDIELARDSKINTLESLITHTRKRGEQLQADLDKLIAKAAADERAGKAPSEKLQSEIESLKRQINTNNEQMANKQKEAETVKADYAHDIERFKELKSIQ